MINSLIFDSHQLIFSTIPAVINYFCELDREIQHEWATFIEGIVRVTFPELM